MKIATILDHIDNGYMALPEFQRGFVWNRDQVRALFDSLYRRHPIGGLLVWATSAERATHRGEGELAPGIVKLLLDGQQRITSLYGVIRGKAPNFFEGNRQTFTGLRFHLEDETFAFYQPLKMQGDPLWVDVTELMQQGYKGLGTCITRLAAVPELAAQSAVYPERLAKLLGITDILIHAEEITGLDKTLDVVVDIFNRVNSGGTKLSKGDLALAKICADWPKARDTMKEHLNAWQEQGYNFGMDWLLRSVNTVITGEAKFQFLHDKDAKTVQDGLARTARHINTCLNMISGRLGLDHDQVLFGRFGIPVMVRYLDKEQKLTGKAWDKLLFWYAQAGMWGRFSGSTESFIDKDLAALENTSQGLDALLEQLRLWNGGLRAEPGHFSSWSLGARFYPVLYMLTRMGAARDWGLGVELKAHMLGKMSRLEVHHIFPKAQLYNNKYSRSEVNALANFCFLTKETNLDISATPPEEYFPRVEAAHPGALASQWIPSDTTLWKIQNYRDFLHARQQLLAQELEKRMCELLHGDNHWLDASGQPNGGTTAADAILDTTSNLDEEAQLTEANTWMQERSLPCGQWTFELVDDTSGKQKAVLDLAWPEGIQEGYSQPAAILLNESAETLAVVSQAGYKCFTNVKSFQQYVESEILA